MADSCIAAVRVHREPEIDIYIYIYLSIYIYAPKRAVLKKLGEPVKSTQKPA